MKKPLVLAATTLAAVTGVAAYTQVGRSDPAAAPMTARVTRGDIVDTVDATGTLQPVTTVQVGTQVSGTIKSLAADFNSRVRRGQVIAVLEPSLFQTQVDQANATVAKLQADVERAAVDVRDTQAKLQRARELSAQQLISASDLETAVDRREPGRRAGQVGAGASRPGTSPARTDPGQPRPHRDHRADRRHRHLAQRRRRSDRGGQHAGADAVRHRARPDADAGDRQRRRVRHRPDAGRAAGVVPCRRLSRRTFTGTVSQVRLQPTVEQNVVSYTTVIDVPNPDAEAQARHDRQRDHRDRARRRRAARAGRGAAIPPASTDGQEDATRAARDEHAAEATASGPSAPCVGLGGRCAAAAPGRDRAH